jgi:tetraacyldisaccharide 4'-kinase
VSSRWRQRIESAWLKRGPLAFTLLPLALLFRAMAALRRLLYRIGWLSSAWLPVPVVVVGNLVVGGAGKTPTVMAVVAALRRHGRVPGIVSRGYGGAGRHAHSVEVDSDPALCGDEPVLLRLRTGAPVVVGRDRVAAARHLLARHPEVDTIVSDDGLQHLALGRDAQVLLFDERGSGNGWLLPAGPLREPLPRAVPDRSIVLYNAAARTTALPGAIAQRALRGMVALPAWWAGVPASLAALEELRGRPLLAAAGLARPQRFFAMLAEHGLSVSALALPDHYDYRELPWPADQPDVVVTEKDAIKIDPRRVGKTRVWVAPLDFGFDTTFEAALIALLPAPGTRHGNSPA